MTEMRISRDLLLLPRLVHDQLALLHEVAR